MKIILTGGHHTSGLLVAKELIQKGDQVFWFGHRQTMVKESAPAAEYTEVLAAGIKFIPLTSGKPVSYDHWWWLKLGQGLLQAFRHLWLIKPDLVVAWGGYLAVPVVIAAWLQGVPTLLHEQTRVSGRANRFLARFAKKVMVAWPDVDYAFPKEKTVVVGLPLRPLILKNRVKQREKTAKTATILVIGGKQGSRILNEAVFLNLEKLLKLAVVVHQTGFANHQADLYQAQRLAARLAPALQPRYQPTAYLNETAMAKVLGKADLVISRAGVHITQELMALNKPALMVPLTIVPGREQLSNAKLLVKLGLAELLPQDQLKEKLVMRVETMLRRIQSYRLSETEVRKLMIDDPLKKIIQVIKTAGKEEE